VRRFYASFSYQAQSWNKPRRVTARQPSALCNFQAAPLDIAELVEHKQRMIAGGPKWRL
jgi:hypothetical protein